MISEFLQGYLIGLVGGLLLAVAFELIRSRW